MNAFLILSIQVTPNENLNTSSSELPVFLSKPLSPTIHHSRSHYDQKNIPFHSCCYHFATNHLWHSSPPRLHSLLHLFFVLSVAFDTRYLYSSTVTTSTPCMFIFPSVFIFIHTHIKSRVNWLSSLFSPMRMSTLSGSLSPAPYRAQCCLQTS